MNPFTILKYKSQLEGNHPRAAEFVKKVIMSGLPEGTIVEVSVTKPGEETKTSNIRVTREDIELFDEVRKNKGKMIYKIICSEIRVVFLLYLGDYSLSFLI